MSYRIDFARKALDRVAKLKERKLFECIRASFEKLATDPLSHGRKAVFPFPPKGQVFHFHCDGEVGRYHFAAFFYFAVDETTLNVFEVTVRPPPPL